MTISIGNGVSTGNIVTAETNSLTGGLRNLLINGAEVFVPYILAQSAVPVILVPNGTVATNGTITLGTALLTTYSVGAWIRLPANAVVGGLAGLYWAVFSSTTVGQVYTNFADPATQFIPTIPSGTLVAAVGSNAAYTQTTGSNITLANITLPGGAPGLNGAVVFNVLHGSINNANAKTKFVNLAGNFMPVDTTLVSKAHSGMLTTLRNMGAAGLQVANGYTSDASAGNTNSLTYFAINTAVDQTIAIGCSMATATDYVLLASFSIQVLPS